MNWEEISENETLSVDFIRENQHCISWIDISMNQTIVESTIEEFSHLVHWNKISRHQNLSYDFICKHWNEISFLNCKKNKCLQLTSHEWDMLLQKEKEKLQKCLHEEPVNWEYICENIYLEENFLRTHIEEINMQSISLYQVLSETFIRDFKDQFDWRNITLFQPMSGSFIEEMEENINWFSLSSVELLASAPSRLKSRGCGRKCLKVS